MALARASAEGLERYRWEVKPTSEIGKFSYKDVKLVVQEEGSWKGTRIHLLPDAHGDLYPSPIEQACFELRDGSGMKCYSIEELRGREFLKDPLIDLDGEIRITPEHATEEIIQILTDQGITRTTWSESIPFKAHGQEIDVTHEFQVTRTLRRAVAKLGFNYLAFVFGRDVALRSEFDSIRRYIRYDFTPMLPVVYPNVEPWMYHPMMEEGQRPVAHWIMVNSELEGDVYLGQVCLFGWMAYLVVLSFAKTGLPGSGHMFNVKDRTIHKLSQGSKEGAVTRFSGPAPQDE